MYHQQGSHHHHRANMSAHRKPLGSLTNNQPTTQQQNESLGVESNYEESASSDWHTTHRELGQIFQQQARDKMIKLRQNNNFQIPTTLKATLYDHQVDGLRWLLHQETNGEVPPFFERHELSGKCKCKITHKLFAELPMPVRGAILADDMGLGKTVQTTALILANPPAGQKGYPYLQSRNKTDAFRCTIIVCPVSVISNWSLQLSKYVSKEARLKVEIYHGPGRHDMLEKICDNKIDVLLTSFDTLASDYKKLELSMESEEKEAEEPNREETEIPTAKPVSR
jgi:SNF2 family DNA or RNA helicase